MKLFAPRKPFVLSLSKDTRANKGTFDQFRSWFDKLTTNGNYRNRA